MHRVQCSTSSVYCETKIYKCENFRITFAACVHFYFPSLCTGSDLSVCRTPSSQCCTQAYLDKVKRELGEELVEELQDEVRSTVRAISSIADTLAECECRGVSVLGWEGMRVGP